MDLDNRVKPLLDMAQWAGIIDNDCEVAALDMEWVTKDRAPTGCRIVITPGLRVSTDAAPVITPEKMLYAMGRKALGDGAGGLITKLLKAHKGDAEQARVVIELAANKDDPLAYVAAVIRSKGKDGMKAQGEAW